MIEVPTTILFVLTTFLALYDKAKEVISSLIGGYGYMILLALLVLSLVFSISLIIKKEAKGFLVYSHNQLARNIAKVSFVVLLTLTPYYTMNVIRDQSALPNEIIGYLYCPGKKPVTNTVIEVINAKNELLSDREWKTDNKGFFIILCTKTVPKSSKLRIFNEASGTYTYLPLNNYKLEENSKPASTNNIYEIETCD